ncbi:MAG TPA: Zn-ribbon domain-containing OB-fold protein [Anaerolineae bacterium]|nr:Zn-ribbon domain-containing OB-fold protein [Anaerolineae bacterium]
MSKTEFTGESFYEFLKECRLMGSRCQSCEALHLPPRALCPSCHGQEMKWEEMGGKGKLVAFTTVHIAPTAMIQAGYGRDNPYCCGIVQLEEGPSISAQILGVDPTKPQDIAIGMEVQVAFVKRGTGEDEGTILAFESAE